MAKEQAAAAKDRRLKKDAHKRATILFAKEKEQTAKALKNKELKKGKSAMEVKRIVELEFGKDKAPSVRTIQQHVAEGKIGESPVQMGQPSKIAESTFLMFCNAFESYVMICQLNEKVEVRKELSARIKLVMDKQLGIGQHKLLMCVLWECAANLLAGRTESVEQQQIM